MDQNTPLLTLLSAEFTLGFARLAIVRLSRWPMQGSGIGADNPLLNAGAEPDARIVSMPPWDEHVRDQPIRD